MTLPPVARWRLGWRHWSWSRKCSWRGVPTPSTRRGTAVPDRHTISRSDPNSDEILKQAVVGREGGRSTRPRWWRRNWQSLTFNWPGGRVLSHYRFVLPLIHFIPDFLRDSVAVFLNSISGRLPGDYGFGFRWLPLACETCSLDRRVAARRRTIVEGLAHVRLL